MAAPLPVSRLFASLQPGDMTTVAADELENKPGIVVGQKGGREVQVTGTAELSAAPDRARVCIRVSSSKGAAAEARSSVLRRLGYIEQTLRQTGLTDENITVSKEIERKANAYQMDAEVCVVFDDFEKLQNICNILVEKLDSSVWISSPHFYHSPENMEQLRRQVCLNAVSNARRKAQDVCRLVGQSLGKAIIIKEEEMKEWEDQEDCASSSIQHKIKRATVYAASKVSATFEIKGKERNKKSC
ncbi:interleukin-1 receptor-associated kinase 1-binding protein 1 [Bufo gargarizans]|uniref:interleukin-1 receptor-associated kinase 1-binding protein 1 n=1 Tax=Bufo gargarizans TaxID=30331 RepID=UPI001CF53460|nr:interleukin-1 receptor-associated kinase 1-binding protein 1 [Bufo gargarizans]